MQASWILQSILWKVELNASVRKVVKFNLTFLQELKHNFMRCSISRTLHGQMTDLVVVGCSTSSTANSHREAANVVLASPIPVRWFCVSETLESFDNGKDLMDILLVSSVPVCWSEESYRLSVMTIFSGKVFATSLWQ